MSSTEIITIVLAIISSSIAIWQGLSAQKQAKYAQEQLQLAKDINKDTQNTLNQIKELVTRVEFSTNQTKKDVETKVDKLIENQNSHQTQLLQSLTALLGNFDPKQKQNDQMTTALMQGFMNGTIDMDKLSSLAEIGNKFNK